MVLQFCLEKPAKNGMAGVLENGIGMENIWNGNKQLWLFDLLKNKTG